ncbi:hypothetical protein DH2020_020411 [Rehmannia glutinosa]|uniref:Uncharacterized protein n=1 Tax=Rehmannia glutinosa TaxID=99300 RepID=A0ABR0WGL3_REHGL
MRNGGTATMAGEFSDDDVEKQRRGGLEDGGAGLAESGAVGQSNDLVEKIIDVVVVDCPNKSEPQLERSSTSHEECRFISITTIAMTYNTKEFTDNEANWVCQEENEEVLINLGCQCRGDLIGQPTLVRLFVMHGRISQSELITSLGPYTSYWVWRVDPAFRAQEHERRCFSPLWVAFSILVGGLLLDVLISVTLGVSALPVNIIIGVIVVLGLGTALRLALEFCQEWNVRRVVQRVEANASIGYHPAL